MRKSFKIVILFLVISSFSSEVFAGRNSEKAYIERYTAFNYITDNLATFGMPKQKKIIAKRARWLARRKARLKRIREKQGKINRRRIKRKYTK